MLNYAYHYTDELQKAFLNYTKEHEMLMFFFPYRFFQLRIEPDTSKKLQFVSVDKNKNIIGIFFMRVDWHTHYVYDFMFVNFTEDKALFSLDLVRLIKKLFEEFKFRKIKYKAIAGHHINEAHKRIAMRYGRMVGTFKEDIRLSDGQWYDLHYYEVTLNDYIIAFKE